MRFRPCIDIHNGKVKQIVGESLQDEGDRAQEHFVSAHDSAYYASLYREAHLTGGHAILLNPASSPYYEKTKEQAMLALRTYPQGLQAGGGITPENAAEFLDAGASHVIVTSYVFQDGRISFSNLEKLARAVGREHLVLDVSCRKKEDGAYYIVTDRWQKMTQVRFDAQTLDALSGFCAEFLVHAADAEGRSAGAVTDIIRLLGSWGKTPVTYAGGIGSYEDLDLVRSAGENRVDVTIGTALDLFGGPLSFEEVLARCDS